MSALNLYLDSNATTPPTPEVMQAVLEGMQCHWANASSSHAAGQTSKQLLVADRAKVARFLGCKPAEVVFTSGATEANHIALRGAVGFNNRMKLVVSAGEHAGVMKLARHLAAQPGVTVDSIGLKVTGELDLAQAHERITDEVALVSVMAANNETGVLMPIGELARMAHERGALLHVDATQLVGKLPFDFARSGADLVSVSAHKFHGPKGMGALLVRQGLNWPALFQGSQERGRRGGTENLPGIHGFAVAAEALTLTAEAWVTRASSVAAMRDRLEQGLLARLPGTVVFGQVQARLPNTSYLRFGLVHADVVLQRLERLGVMASSGAACSSGGHEPSHVLVAMGVPRDEAMCAVRLSLPDDLQPSAIDPLLDRLSAELAPLMVDTPNDSQPSVAPPGVFA